MFQLWKFVLLCGLLAGTLASSEDGGNDTESAADSPKSVLHKGLEAIEKNLDAVLEKLKAKLDMLQDSKVWQIAKQKFQQAEKLVNDALSNIFSALDEAFGLTISNAHITDVKAELTADGKGLNLQLPVTADVKVILPLIRQTVNLKASLDILTTVRIETDAKTGAPTVVMTECASNPDSISFTLLGKHSVLVNNFVDTMSSFLSKTVSFLVQKQICPLARIFVSTVDVDFVQNVIDKLLQGVQVTLHP
ncbi:BPI fold-containing family A member 2 isoform 1-T2 [Molossus nigricans]